MPCELSGAGDSMDEEGSVLATLSGPCLWSEEVVCTAAALVAQLAGEGRYAGSGEDRQEMDFDKRLHLLQAALVFGASFRVGAWQLS